MAQQELAEAEYARQAVFWHYGDVIFEKECADISPFGDRVDLDWSRLHLMEAAEKKAAADYEARHRTAAQLAGDLEVVQKVIVDLKKSRDWSNFHENRSQQSRV